MKVKYCGITKEEEIQYLQKLPIDYVGFVFYKKSKRFVDKEQARRLREKLNPSIPGVGVFVEEEIPKILELLQEGIIQGVQLHGEEEESYVLKLKEKMKQLSMHCTPAWVTSAKLPARSGCGRGSRSHPSTRSPRRRQGSAPHAE